MNVTSRGMQNARLRAGHTIIQTATIIETSVNTIVNLEQRGEVPKSVHLQKALLEYITKYKETKKS